MRIESENSPDVVALSVIHRDCFAPGWSEEAFAGLFATPGTLAFVAHNNAGFGVLRIVGDEAEIITMAVLFRNRRSGIGNMIVDSMVHFAKACGVKTVFLEVRKSNIAAMALYHKFGFSEISCRERYYHNSDGSSEDAIVMKKVLSA
jgi:ribosomal-protein-alanine N-acetyltransferase